MKLTAIGLMALLFLLAGCQTASDIQDLGGDRYGVSSLACPACGGTAQSSSLASEKASKHCASLGKVVVPETQDNQLANSFGAGRTDLVFSCVDEVTETDTESCYQTAFASLQESHDENVLARAVAIVMPPEEGFPFAVLANENKASQAEVSALTAVGTVWETCSRESWSNVSPQYRDIYIATSNEMLASLSKLVATKNSYGEYAAEINASLAKLDQQLGGVERNARAQRSLENRARMEAATNLSDRIRQSTDTVTCTNYGNTTTCR